MKKNITFFICFTLIILIPSITSSNRVKLAYNIAKGTESSDPSGYVIFQNKLYFAAKEIKGNEVRRRFWSYNGVNHPQKFKDVTPSEYYWHNNSNIFSTVFNGKLYFRANDWSHGDELWVYDGKKPPSIVADIYPGGGWSHPSYLTVFNYKLYFRAYYGTHGAELWVYNGINPPSMLADIHPIISHYISSSPSSLTIYNNKLYFSANDGTHGRELWVYDGINSPQMTADIHPNKGYFKSSSSPFNLTVYNNKLYFSANDGTHGRELWVYDGINSPQMAADIHPNNGYYEPSSSPSSLTVYNNKLYFSANDGTHGEELWVYDGINSPQMAADIHPNNGYYESSSNPSNLTVYNNKLYFSANDGTHGRELWIYNGQNQPRIVADIYPGKQGANPYDLISFKNKLYFSAEHKDFGYELWKYNGVSSPTLAVDICQYGRSSNPSNFVMFKDNMFFSINNNKMYVFNGFQSPIEVKDFSNVCRYYGKSALFNGMLYFCGDDEIHGKELWVYEGKKPPRMVADINFDKFNSDPEFLTVYNNKLYFSANSDYEIYCDESWEKDRELWEYNGIDTPSRVADINPGDSSSSPSHLTIFKNKLFFIADKDNSRGSELYEYDGCSLSIKATHVNAWGGLASVKNKLYFVVDSESYVKELWQYDGRNSPKFIQKVPNSIGRLKGFKGKIYFVMDDDSYGNELFVFDGINPPTLVADIRDGSNSSHPRDLFIYQNHLIFSADDGIWGRELWIHDGSNAPMLLKDIYKGECSSSPKDFFEYKNQLYFSANDGINGNELWVLRLRGKLDFEPPENPDYPPTVIITNPRNNTTVKGIVNIQVSASDDIGINRIEFYIDHELKYTTKTTSSKNIPVKAENNNYHYEWDTTDYRYGTHHIEAIAYDSINQRSMDAVYVMVQNMTIDLQATRHTEKAWIIKKQYGKIIFSVNKFANIPIDKYIIYKRTDTGEYQEIKQITESDLLNGSYTFFDKYLEKNKIYTYKVIAKDTRGKTIAFSNEVMVE